MSVAKRLIEEELDRNMRQADIEEGYMNCDQCSKPNASYVIEEGPEAGHVFCDPTCHTEWHKAHPPEEYVPLPPPEPENPPYTPPWPPPPPP